MLAIFEFLFCACFLAANSFWWLKGLLVAKKRAYKAAKGLSISPSATIDLLLLFYHLHPTALTLYPTVDLISLVTTQIRDILDTSFTPFLAGSAIPSHILSYPLISPHIPSYPLISPHIHIHDTYTYTSTSHHETHNNTLPSILPSTPPIPTLFLNHPIRP